jgi:hypothetical protein
LTNHGICCKLEPHRYAGGKTIANLMIVTRRSCTTSTRALHRIWVWSNAILPPPLPTLTCIKWVPCHHSMTRSQVADIWDGLHICRTFESNCGQSTKPSTPASRLAVQEPPIPRNMFGVTGDTFMKQAEGVWHIACPCRWYHSNAMIAERVLFYVVRGKWTDVLEDVSPPLSGLKSKLCLQPAWFLAWLSLEPRILRLHIPPKCWLTFNGLHGVISQKIQLFIITAVWTSDYTVLAYTYLFMDLFNSILSSGL